MTPPRRKLQLTPRTALWLLLDVAGMLSFAAGVMYLVQGASLFGRWPADTLQAGVMIAAGAVLMLFAAAQLLRAALEQGAGNTRSGK